MRPFLNKPLLISIAILISFCQSVCNQASGYDDRRQNTRELTVATYNVEWAFTAGCTNYAAFPADLWGAPGPHPNHQYFMKENTNGYTPLTLHIANIAQYILSLNDGKGADIVMLQELCDCSSLDLINAYINYHNNNDFGYRPWIPDGQGNGLVVGMLTRIDPVDIVNYAGDGNRGLRAIIPIWEQHFHVYGVHFAAGVAQRQRDNQARNLENHYIRYLPNVIVAGDFNGGKEEIAQTDTNPFRITDAPQITYATWNGKMIHFWYSQAPINDNWPLVQFYDGTGTSQLGITDTDFTEAYGKHLSQIVYFQGGGGGQHTLNCVDYLQCFAALNTVCTAVSVVRVISITFIDAQNAAYPVKIAGNYIHPAINGPHGVVNDLCRPWNHGVNGAIRATSRIYLRTWSVANMNNQLEITRDDTPPSRYLGDGAPKTQFFLCRISFGGYDYDVDDYHAAIQTMNKLAALAPVDGFQLTLRRIDEFGTRLYGLTNADINGLGNVGLPDYRSIERNQKISSVPGGPDWPLKGEWTHWNCEGIKAGKPGNHRMNTIDYIWYGTGFGTAILPNVVAESTQYIHNIGQYCYDFEHIPPHYIYSDHEPVMVTFRQIGDEGTHIETLPVVDTEFRYSPDQMFVHSRMDQRFAEEEFQHSHIQQQQSMLPQRYTPDEYAHLYGQQPEQHIYEGNQPQMLLERYMDDGNTGSKQQEENEI